MINAAATTTLLSGTGQADAASRISAAALNGKKSMSAERAQSVAKDFEALFVAQMLEQMFGESMGEGLFGDKETDEIYKGLMMEQYGKEIAKGGGIGVAPYVQKELLKLQEITP